MLIYLQIKLHEHWKDTTTVTWALHEALDQHYSGEVARITAVIEDVDDEDKTAQPIDITNCLRLQYQVTVLI